MHASVTLQSSWLLVLRSAHHQLLTRWCVRCQLPRRFSLVKGDYCAHSHSHHRDKHEEAAYKWCMHQRRTISFQNATLWKWWTPKVVVKFNIHNSVWSCSGQPPHTVKGQEKKKRSIWWRECAERWVFTTVSDSSQTFASTPRVTLKVTNKLCCFCFFTGRVWGVTSSWPSLSKTREELVY